MGRFHFWWISFTAYNEMSPWSVGSLLPTRGPELHPPLLSGWKSPLPVPHLCFLPECPVTFKEQVETLSVNAPDTCRSEFKARVKKIFKFPFEILLASFLRRHVKTPICDGVWVRQVHKHTGCIFLLKDHVVFFPMKCSWTAAAFGATTWFLKLNKVTQSLPTGLLPPLFLSHFKRLHPHLAIERRQHQEEKYAVRK